MLRDHLRQEHPYVVHDDQVRTIVAARAYDYEHALVYGGGTGPDEEFGPEPY